MSDYTIQKSTLLKRIMLRASKYSGLILLAGIVLILLSYIDDIFPLTEWKELFNLTDKVGTLFIALAVLTFIYKCITLTSRHYEQSFAKNHKISALVLNRTRKSLRVVFVLAAIHITIAFLGPDKFYLVLANNIIYTIMLLTIGWIAIQLFQMIEAISYEHAMRQTHGQHVRAKALYTRMHILRNIATVLIIIITISAIFMSFSSFRNLGVSLLASAGVVTAIVGLSAQKTLGSLFAGFQIAMSQTIRIGDIIAIENANGTVEEINFTTITLKLDDRRRMIIPINYLIDKPFENWTREADSMGGSLLLYVDYLLPIEPLRDQLNEILRASEYWDGEIGKLQVANLTDRAVEVRIQITAANAEKLSELRSEIKEKLLQFIQEKYPQHLPKVRFDRNSIEL